MEKVETPTKGVKNNYFNLALCAFSFVFLLVYLFVVDDVSEVVKNLQSLNWAWISVAVLFMVMYWLLEAYVLHLTLKPLHSTQRLGVTFRISMIGQYFNAITPFASGGQPMQAYFLLKRGMPLGKSMTGLLTKFIIYQITLTFYCLTMLLLRYQYFATHRSTLMIGVLVGFIIQLAVMVLLISAAFFKSGTIRFVTWLIHLLTKIKIVRHPKEKLIYWSNELEIFHDQFQYLLKNKGQLIKMCLLSALQLTAFFIIGNVIYRSFGLSGEDSLAMIACQAFVLLITSFVPLPGALLAAEGVFFLFFSLYFPENQISLAIIMWRFITFYFPIIVGLIFTLLEKKQDTPLSTQEVQAEK